MKRMLSAVLFLVLLLGTVQVYANDANNDKQTLPVLIINNSYEDTARSMAKTKAEIPPLLINSVTKDSTYNVKEIDNVFNIRDVASTEKNDILDMFKETNYPAVILVEILPVHDHPYGYSFYSIHVKVLDLKIQKYLYNGKLWHEKRDFHKAFDEMSIELDGILKTVFKM